jgi:DNA-binding response OmpR family regulator
MQQRIAMIEDEPDLVEMVGYNFVREGFDFRGFTRGKPGLDYLRANRVDLLLLDIMLPDDDGLDICRRLRADDRLQTLPVVFLTAKGEEVDRILGLELGADDYVVKPFSPRELVARIKAVLRRQSRPPGPGDVIDIRELRLDARTQDVSVRGVPVALSALEFRLLFFLAAHPRQVFSRERLLDEIWGGDRCITPRTVDVHIRRLREKIEARPEEPAYIGTVRGAGYRFLGQPIEV